MTKLETFREAAAASFDAPTENIVGASDVMNAAFDDWKTEPDVVSQALTLIDDPNPMVRYMVAVLLRPTHRERADTIFDALANDEDAGICRIWAKYG